MDRESKTDPEGPFEALPQDRTDAELLRESIATYDQVAELYERRWFDFWKTTKGFSVLDQLKSALPKASAILDIGSGVGDIASFFATAGHVVTCVDISEGMLKVVQRRTPQARCLVMDMRSLALPANSFDLVVMSHALPFLTDLDQVSALDHAWRVVRPGGSLYVSACGKDAGIRVWTSDTGNEVGKVYLHRTSGEHCREILGQRKDIESCHFESFGAPRFDFYLVARKSIDLS